MKKTVIAITLISALLITATATTFLEPYAQAASVSGNSVPTLLWQNHFGFPPGTKDDGRDWSSPTVVNGIVYIGATTVVNGFPYYPNPPPDYVLDWWSDFYAFNASNGALIWDYRDNSSLIYSTCAVADGVVFFGAGSYDTGSVLALNASSGALLWNYTTNKGISSLTVANGIVYFTVGYYPYTLYALNATSGNKIWELSGYGRASPKIVNGILYIGSQDDYNLNALNASSGNPIWNYTAERYVMSTPAVAGGVAYFSADKNIYALNATTGVKLWNYSTTVVLSNYGYGIDYEFSSPTFANGIVYIFSNREQNLIALKASNGVKLWNYTRAVGNPPTITNGVIYVDINDYLCALNAYNGKKIWDSSLPAVDFNTVPATSPAVTDNALYFGYGTALYALELPSSASITSSATIVRALTDDGQMVNLTISGNVTSSQISNAYITSDQSTSAVYLTVTGVGGTAGFSNMTIQKDLICNGTIPTIYIDDQIAEKQGYAQDGDNYYVWYTVDLSSHQISIMFSGSQNLKSSSLPNYVIWLGAAFAAFIIAVAVIVIYKKHSMRSTR
jgi:outer membrane protein assembly factor BamB